MPGSSTGVWDKKGDNMGPLIILSSTKKQQTIWGSQENCHYRLFSGARFLSPPRDVTKLDGDPEDGGGVGTYARLKRTNTHHQSRTNTYLKSNPSHFINNPVYLKLLCMRIIRL